MFQNPIIHRELVGLLRTKKAIAIQVALVFMFAVLVILRWPVDPTSDLDGVKAMQVFRLFGYGILSALVLFIPVFPATSVVRERHAGTLALVLNSPLTSLNVYIGKLTGVMAFVVLLLFLSLPSLIACLGMGGLDLTADVLPLYGLLLLTAFQYTTMGLMVSCLANTVDSALRITYGLVLLMSILVMGPHLFTQGTDTWVADFNGWLRCVSPVPAVMDVLGHGDIGSYGLGSNENSIGRYCLIACISSIFFVGRAISLLNFKLFDRARSQGTMTHSLSERAQRFRDVFFMGMDPQRRKSPIPRFVNPIIYKEFRSRRFGRAHWIVRMMAACVIISVALAIASTQGSEKWGPEIINGIMANLQFGLVILVTPSLAAGLISSELESGSWRLLKMTPMSPFRIFTGKLMSVLVTVGLILIATIPGYIVLLQVQRGLIGQIGQIVVCLVLTGAFCFALSMAISTMCRVTATATSISFGLLLLIFAGTFLVWLGRGSPFSNETVTTILTINPLATAFGILDVQGFAQFQNVIPVGMPWGEDNEFMMPVNWILMSILTVVLLVIITVRLDKLTKPE